MNILLKNKITEFGFEIEGVDDLVYYLYHFSEFTHLSEDCLARIILYSFQDIGYFEDSKELKEHIKYTYL